MKDVAKELSQAETRKTEGKGHRMVIEETDGEDSDSEEGQDQEEIIIKPGGGVERSNITPTEQPVNKNDVFTELKIDHQHAEPGKL